MGEEDSVNGWARVFSINPASDLDELLTMVEIKDAMDEMDLSFSTRAELVETSAIRSKVLQQCYQRCLRLMDRFAVLTEQVEADSVYAHWIERQEKSFTLRLSPVVIADSLSPFFREPNKSWIFTSATLALNDRIALFQTLLGVHETLTK